jgi:cytochrome b6-f complex iron-sulfur subunit
MAPSRPTSRRRALGVIAQLPLWVSAAGSAAIAGCSAAIGRLGRHRGVEVGPLDRVPPGGALRASLGGDDAAIVVNVDGTIRAFRAVCTHEGCPLGWNAQQHLIRCPCHGGAYDTNGHVVSGPPPAPLTELRTVVEHGSIYVAP